MPSFLSSSARLALWYLCGAGLGISALLWSTYLLTQRAMERQVDLVVETEIESLREDYRGGGIARLIEVLDQRDDDWGRLGAAYLLMDREGNQLAGNLSSWPKEFAATGAWLEFDIRASERGHAVDHPVRATVVTLDGNRLLVGTDVSERRRFTARLRSTTYRGMGLTVAFMALTGLWFSRRVAARVRAVAQACKRIISGDLTRRLPLERNADEFDQLASAVNGMLDRVEQQTAIVHVTFNSAAHDLRAPLFRMRARLEAALATATAGGAGDKGPAAAAAMRATIDDLERVQRTLATLLQIAQAEAGGNNATRERVDLAQMVRELGELYEPEARERGLTLKVQADSPALLSAHQQLLAQLVTNLLENALKYVPSGGGIRIEVAAAEALVRLTVSDDGPGIPTALHAEMLLPFRRQVRDAAAPGSGLGLSLVAAVVRLHQGTLETLDAAPGLIVRCSFPALGPAMEASHA
ncbi:MAG TPA: HAMP domain-containing sensor histidine kinase [Steroidobacteraceae bacterium]|nr:HAMP domain-containing sensor histidine kinase [Steroidobacteraceae bacterium]